MAGERSIGCLMVADLPVAYELAARPEMGRRPVAVAHPDGTVWSTSPLSAAEGVLEGQRLSEAVGLCPTLVVLDARPARYEALHARMLDAVERVVPGVEDAGLGVAHVDLTGAVRSHGSAERLHAALLRCVPAALGPRLGVGPTKFVARLAAARPTPPHHSAPSPARPSPTGLRHAYLASTGASPGRLPPIGSDSDCRVSAVGAAVTAAVDAGAGAGAVTVVAGSAVGEFLAPVPVGALPVDAEVVRRLRLVGITTVGQVARIPRRALVAQLGRDGARLVDLLDGVDEPVRPRPRVEHVEERLRAGEPLTQRVALLAAAEHVLLRALQQLRRTHRVARQVVVHVETEQGQQWKATVTLRRPSAEPDRVWLAVAPVVERAQLPGPVVELTVELHGLRAAQGWQGELELSERGRRARRERVEETLRQLQARYGGRRVVGRMAPLDPWNRIPERRWGVVDHD